MARPPSYTEQTGPRLSMAHLDEWRSILCRPITFSMITYVAGCRLYRVSSVNFPASTYSQAQVDAFRARHTAYLDKLNKASMTGRHPCLPSSYLSSTHNP